MPNKGLFGKNNENGWRRLLKELIIRQKFWVPCEREARARRSTIVLYTLDNPSINN